MKMSNNSGKIFLYPETEFEKNILLSKYTQSKLAYLYSNKYIDEFTILIDKKNSCLNLEKNMACINSDLSELQIVYLLRVIIDAYSIYKGLLPLHSAMIESNKCNVFIFGDTKCGKSLISNDIGVNNKGLSLIGDDHIIISKEYILGNSVSRLRNCDNEEIYKFNKRISEYNKYFIFDIDIRKNKDNLIKINPIKYKSIDLTYALKYINCDFCTRIENIFMNDFVGLSIKKKYINYFEKFIDNAISIFKIEGSKEYIISNINRIIELNK